MQLSNQQAAAMKAIVEWYGDKHRREFYLAGYAGTTTPLSGRWSSRRIW